MLLVLAEPGWNQIDLDWQVMLKAAECVAFVGEAELSARMSGGMAPAAIVSWRRASRWTALLVCSDPMAEKVAVVQRLLTP